MKRRRNRKKGFTLIEIIVVLAILGLILAIATPNYLAVQENQRETACETTREYLQRRIALDLAMESGVNEETLLGIENNEMMSQSPVCSSGGVYSLVEGDDGYSVACSLHTNFVEMKTILGNTRKEIVEGFIALAAQFEEENDKYPRSWGEFVFSDIGLRSEDWEQPIDHILYEPKGDRLGLVPEENYKFTVVMNTGETKELTSQLNYALLYSYIEQKWYYQEIKDGNEIDYELLVITPD